MYILENNIRSINIKNKPIRDKPYLYIGNFKNQRVTHRKLNMKIIKESFLFSLNICFSKGKMNKMTKIIKI